MKSEIWPQKGAKKHEKNLSIFAEMTLFSNFRRMKAGSLDGPVKTLHGERK